MRTRSRPLLRHLSRAAGVLAVAALAACGGSDAQDAPAETPPTVLAESDVAVARQTDLTTGIALTGSLEPEDRVTLTAQVGGTMASVRVDRGTPVRRGQLLATIEAEGVRSQAAGARAGVAAARANLEVARKQRDAATRLFQAGATSALDAQQAQAAFEAAEAQLAAARAQDAAAGESAARTTITAPITGIVSARQVEPGEAVSSGDPILTVVNITALEFAGQVPVDQASWVRVGQPVTFTLDAYPGRELTGTVARKDPAADPATRQVGIFVRLPNPKGEIVAGQFARGRIAGQRVRDAVVLPATAVQGSGEQSAVLAIEDGRLVRRPVTTGARDDAAGLVAITSGVTAGDRVLARPAPNVAEGLRVVIANEAALGSRPSALGAPGAADSAREKR